MKAICIKSAEAKLKDIELLEIPETEVGETEVIVEIYSVGLNPADYRMVTEPGPVPRQFPFIIGSDFSGVVVKTGNKVKEFKIGDEVYGKPQIPNFGALVERFAIDQEFIIKKPKKISHSQASTIPVTFHTAYMNLVTKANLKPGQTVLILGGAGGVGSTAIQLAKEIGAKVIATGLTKDIPRINEIGADAVIDSQNCELDNITDKVDVMFDTVGLKAQAEAVHLVKDGGTIVSCAVIETDSSISNNKTLNFIQFEFAHGNGTAFELVNEMIEKGIYKPAFEKEVPFTAAAVEEALNSIWENRKTGRIVVKIK